MSRTPDELKFMCDECYGDIGTHQKAVQTLDGEWVHINCTPAYFPYQCTNPECGYYWGDTDDDNECPECGFDLTSTDAQKLLAYMEKVAEVPRIESQ